jgi:hypothetical protein
VRCRRLSERSLPACALGLARGLERRLSATRQAPCPRGSISPRTTRSSSARRHPESH